MTKTQKIQAINKHIKDGDLISHIVCMGMLQEHIFTGWDGEWLMGMPTTETMRHGGMAYEANDISPTNVTHINRTALEALDI